MQRFAVFAFAIAAIIGLVPVGTAGALPADFVAPPFSIIGTVTDENGTPLAGVSVNDSDFFSFASTDAEGQYLLEGLQAGNTYVVMATDPTGGHSPASSEPVVVSDVEGALATTIVMQRVVTTSISGTVTDTAGAPIGGVLVSDNFSGASTTTAADGTYTLSGLIGGETYALSASDPSGLHGAAESEFGTVAADGSTVVDLTLPDVVVAIAGTITDPDGLPVAGVRVSLVGFFGFSKTTGADGSFALADIPDGEYTVSIDPRSVRPELRPIEVPVTVVAGAVADASVQLTRTATFDVTVTAAGVPADAEISLWNEQFGRVGFGFTDENGDATIPVLNDGTYYLQIDSRTPGYASEYFPDTIFRAAAQRFTVAGEQHLPVVVDLEAEAVITGTITMPDGAPGNSFDVGAQPAGPVDIQPELSPCNLPAPDDPPGTFRIGCLHPSVDWIIKGFGVGAADNGYYPDSQSAFNATPIPVAPGQTVSGIALQLKPKSPNPTLLGLSQQYFLTGTTTPGVRVHGTNFPADFHAITITASDAAFFHPATVTVTGRVSANELIATVTVPAGDIGPFPASKELLVTTSIGGFAEGGATLVIGDATTPVATVAGRVTDSRGRGIGGVPVIVRSTTIDEFGVTRQTSVLSGPDGRWRAQGVPPGTYTVQFEGTEAYNPQFWKQRTTLAAATPITLRNGEVRTGIDAQLTNRGPIKVLSASPKLQVSNLSFDLLGQGLSSIRGGFRVSVATPFGAIPLQAQSVSSTRLRVTGFTPPGTWDIVTQWTAGDGTVKSTTCVRCITVYDDLSAFSFDNVVPPGTTATITYFGGGLVDITNVAVGGRDVKVVSYRVFDGGTIEITFAVRKDAALGSRPVTITRVDGRSTTTDVVVGSPF